MTREDLYGAAFRYKKTGLWRKLWDTEMFALKLSDGRIGYINVLGRNGEFCGLSVYIGDEGFASLRDIMECSYTGLSEFREHEKLLRQKCLQLSLDTKDCLREEELAEVRDYAKRHGISFAGKNAFPQFSKYEPNYHPWIVRDPEDITALYEALVCVTLLADMLKKDSPADLGILPFTEQTTEMPMFSIKDGKLNKERFTAIPAAVKKTYPDVILKDEFPVVLAKRLAKKGVWETELVRMLEAVQDEPEETPYYPLLLMMVDRADGYMLPITMTIDGDTRPDGILLAMIDAAKGHDLFPREILCRDERTYALLRDLCKKVGTKIRIADKPLRALDKAQVEFCERERMGDQANLDVLLPMIDEILAMDDKDLKSIPKRLVDMLRVAALGGFLPEDVGEKLWNKLMEL